jgi:hypothetical protein
MRSLHIERQGPFVGDMNTYQTRHAAIHVPGHGRDRYEPTVVRVEFSVECVVHEPRVIRHPREDLLVKRFRAIQTDRWVCVYATNGSPRDRMRHDARLRGERCLAYPYTRIAEMP